MYQKACDDEAAEALAAVTAEDAEERADAARLVARVAGAARGSRKALSEARYATSLQQMRIRDVDVAMETADLTRNSIMQQAATSILQQANVQPQIALSLLQG